MENTNLNVGVKTEKAKDFDFFDELGERTYSVLGSFVDLVGDKPIELITNIEMTIAQYKVGALTKKGAKGVLASFLGNSAITVIENFLDLDLTVMHSVFDTIGDISAIMLAIGLYRDTKVAWKTATSMTPEEVIAKRKEKVQSATNFVDGFLA